jgi:hypothetical protein
MSDYNAIIKKSLKQKWSSHFVISAENLSNVRFAELDEQIKARVLISLLNTPSSSSSSSSHTELVHSILQRFVDDKSPEALSWLKLTGGQVSALLRPNASSSGSNKSSAVLNADAEMALAKLIGQLSNAPIPSLLEPLENAYVKSSSGTSGSGSSSGNGLEVKTCPCCGFLFLYLQCSALGSSA